MARSIDSAKRIINGLYGEVWVDGEKIAECTACQAKVAKNKQTVNLCGQFMDDTKVTSGSGTGSLRHKSRETEHSDRSFPMFGPKKVCPSYRDVLIICFFDLCVN